MAIIWHDAADAMNELDVQSDRMTLDQKLQLAQIKALVAIGQELSIIHHEGINPQYDPR